MSKKITGEKETRANLLGWSRKYGCESELIKIFARYDDLLKGARTEEERRAISVAGLVEIDQFFAGHGAKNDIHVYVDLKGKP